MPGMFNSTPQMGGGGARRPVPGAAPAAGASAINAAARAKAAANAAAEAQKAQTQQTTQQTQNMAPSVRSLVDGPAVSQGAYEQQAQTQLQGNIQGQESAAQRAHATQQQQAEMQARLKEQEAAAAAQRGEMELSARLSAEADARRAGTVKSLMAQPMPGEGGGDAAPAADQGAARAAVFAREKDRIGQIGRASLNSLQNVIGERGLAGGGYEADATASLLGDVNSDLVDVVRDQSIGEADRAAEIEDRNYTGNLTKRGQDLGMRQSLLSLMGGRGAY